MNALDKLDARWQAGGRICVGLDSDFELLPEIFKNNGTYNGQRSFNAAIVRNTMDLAYAYKLNLADYIEHGSTGINALVDSFAFIHHKAPEVPTILDCKFGDALPDKNAKYAKFAFEVCKADAITAQVYAGGDAAEGFTRYADKLIFFLCKTSNDDSDEFQGIEVKRGNAQFTHQGDPVLLYQDVAMSVMAHWNKHSNCGLVVGATYPEQMKKIRTMAGDLPILSSGVGKQAGNFEATVRAGLVPDKSRLLINEDRSVIFAPYDEHKQKYEDPDTFALAARERLVARTAEYNKILELAMA